MATLARQTISEDGSDLTFVAATTGAGDVATNTDGRTFMILKNGSGAPVTMTVAEQISGTTVEDPTYGTVSKASAAVTVAAGGTGMMGPFKKTAFNNSSGQIVITYSAVTDITVAALYIP